VADPIGKKAPENAVRVIVSEAMRPRQKHRSRLDLRHLDELARRQSPVHQLHPAASLLTTLAFLVALTSVESDAVSQLLPFLFFPILLFALSDLPVWLIGRRVLLVEPLLIGIGLLNPLLDRQPIQFGGLTVAHGWLVLLAILLKGSLTVTAALLLIAVTGMEKLAATLCQLKVPRLLVTVLLLVYRYIYTLSDEAARIQLAYALRAPDHPGIRPAAWGSLAGQILLRSFDRADRLYQAMSLRGFTGVIPTGPAGRFRRADAAWCLGWTAFFALARFFDLPLLLGSWIIGVLA
jgi:cobalt/nickel transport system permease protein